MKKQANHFEIQPSKDGTLVYMTYLIELGAHRMKGYNHHLSLNIDDCISCTRCMRVCSTEAI